MEDRYNEKNEGYLTLHDCRAARAELNDGVLSFWFDEGFWITASHPENPTGKTVRTGPARVDYVLREQSGDDVSVDVFTRLRWPHALRTAWELPRLLEKLNRDGWELEFLYQYPGGWDRVVECWLWFPKRPYHKECRLKVDAVEVIYRWNELQPEREW